MNYIIGRKSKTARNAGSVILGVAMFILITVLCFCDSELSFLLMDADNLCGLGLHFEFDGFRKIYCVIISFMWMMTTLFSPEYLKHYRNRNRYYLFTMLTYGATLGVFLSADLFTTFIFFEIMSFTSYVWVAQDEREESLRAAGTYLAIAVIGGLVMLMGLFLLYNMTGTLSIADLREAIELYKVNGSLTRLYVTCGCIFFGFAAKAGAFPLHIWLPKAHPVAPAPASALLSGVLTKAGVFGILVVSFRILLGDAAWGKTVLVIGLITMVLGAVLALFSIDLKRTLACSSMSQIGFILVGIGMGTLLGEEGAIAARGSLLHMLNHSLIKLVLFMAAGVVYMNTHNLDLNKIRGYGRNKLFLKHCFLIGGLGISGIPLFNGYISKTLLHEAILEGSGLLANPTLVEWIFLVSGGLTLAYMTKLYVAVFVEKNQYAAIQQQYDEGKKYLNVSGRIAIGVSAAVLPVLGIIPYFTMDYLADLGTDFMGMDSFKGQVNYFNLENLKGGFISIAIGVLVYVVIVRLLLMRKDQTEAVSKKEYVNGWPASLDLENRIYRPLFLKILPMIFGVLCRILDCLVDSIVVLLRKTVYHDRPVPHEREEGTAGSHILGRIMDLMNMFLNKTVRRRNPKIMECSYEHRLAIKREEIRENNIIIARSLSFGLALACLGMLLTIGYLLYNLLA